MNDAPLRGHWPMYIAANPAQSGPYHLFPFLTQQNQTFEHLRQHIEFEMPLLRDQAFPTIQGGDCRRSFPSIRYALAVCILPL